MTTGVAEKIRHAVNELMDRNESTVVMSDFNHEWFLNCCQFVWRRQRNYDWREKLQTHWAEWVLHDDSTYTVHNECVFTLTVDNNRKCPSSHVLTWLEMNSRYERHIVYWFIIWIISHQPWAGVHHSGGTSMNSNWLSVRGQRVSLFRTGWGSAVPWCFVSQVFSTCTGTNSAVNSEWADPTLWIQTVRSAGRHDEWHHRNVITMATKIKQNTEGMF